MLGIPANADLGADQQPREIGVFAEEGQPSMAVGHEPEIKLTSSSPASSQAVTDGHRRFQAVQLGRGIAR
jgi:hypothetical protein